MSIRRSERQASATYSHKVIPKKHRPIQIVVNRPGTKKPKVTPKDKSQYHHTITKREENGHTYLKFTWKKIKQEDTTY